MSVLAPLYIAGLLAVSLPIFFHLIRRTPRGQMPFSSLMFLSPSPPRVTRRSRLDHILLLILRGLALALLAFAFARPFMRDDANLNIADKPSRRIAVLIDRSASMRRADLWAQAKAKVDKLLADVTPADQVALLAFADRIDTLVRFDTWNETESPRRAALVRGALEQAVPGWGATQLADALVTASDMLADASDSSDQSAERVQQIVLISDMQHGARLEALQAYAWPKGVVVDVQSVAPRAATNAGLHLSGDTDETESETLDVRLRVRVSNEPDSTTEQFTLHWATAQAELAAVEPIKAYVPPGTSRIVRVPRPVAASVADRLVLHGDESDFDNTLFLAPQRQEEVTVVYFGSDAAEDTQGMRYYVERALADTPRRKVRLVAVAKDAPLDPRDLESMRLAIVGEPLPEDRLDVLRRYVARGGTLLVPVIDAEATTVQRLLEAPELTVEEATGRDFALLGEMTYSHPLFAAFADPRFGDFTKIRFWKHRRVRGIPSEQTKVLAKFDNGDAAIIERTVDAGSIVVLASSWRTADSQLALSSKFVPLLGAIVDRRGDPRSDETQFTVGQRVPLAKPEPGATLRVVGPGGKSFTLAEGIATFEETAEPGVYASGERRFCVNLSADESRTAPLGVEELEQRGARLGNEEARQIEADRKRQLRVAELENRQKLWRWLIVAVLGLVIAETAVAGKLARNPPADSG